VRGLIIEGLMYLYPGKKQSIFEISEMTISVSQS